MSFIHPLILCGGVGTRLWPLSRTQQPKQFQSISGEGSLTFFQATVQRHHRGIFATPWISVSQEHVPTVMRQLRDIQCAARIIAEPVARNTGPAVLAAALSLHAEDQDAVVLVLPSDHVIAGDLNGRVGGAMGAVQDGHIITFGIAPRYPETGYGYVVDGGEYETHPGIHRVAQFIEKPDEALARSLIAAGDAYWSSGISLFRADVLIEEYKRADPATHSAVCMALGSGTHTPAGILLDTTFFAMARSEPTERAVFETSTRISLAPTKISWDDVGAWAAFHALGAKTDDGNVTSGDVLMIDTKDSFVRGNGRLVAVVGMSDVIVVDTHDAVLVTSRQNSQKVKQMVEKMIDLKRREVNDSTSRATDWGSVSQVAHGRGFELSVLLVSPGASLVLDALPDRRRLLTVASGRATLAGSNDSHDVLTVGSTIEVGTGESVVLTNGLGGVLEVVQVSCEVGMASDDHKLADLTGIPIGEREYV